MLPPFDQCFSALLEDLHNRGMLRDTLVVCMGEFGRPPRNLSSGPKRLPSSWRYNEVTYMEANMRTLRVLVVEDDKDTATSLAMLLRLFATVIVLVCAVGLSRMFTSSLGGIVQTNSAQVQAFSLMTSGEDWLHIPGLRIPYWLLRATGMWSIRRSVSSIHSGTTGSNSTQRVRTFRAVLINQEAGSRASQTCASRCAPASSVHSKVTFVASLPLVR